MAYPRPSETTAQPATVTTAIGDLDAVIDRAETYAERLQKVSDRIHGPRPAEVTGNNYEKQAQPLSLMSEIAMRRARLVNALDRIESALNGIEGGI